MKKLTGLFLAILLAGGIILKPCETHNKMDLCWINEEIHPYGGGLGDEQKKLNFKRYFDMEEL